MDFQIRITETALADLEEILAYSWANFSATAERFGGALVKMMLSKPHVYRVIYRILEKQKQVDVLHIRHGAREDFKTLELD